MKNNMKKQSCGLVEIVEPPFNFMDMRQQQLPTEHYDFLF